jgi:hypothetical protein
VLLRAGRNSIIALAGEAMHGWQDVFVQDIMLGRGEGCRCRQSLVTRSRGRS